MSPRHSHALPECPIHERVLICPACVGARGGAVGGRASSPKKTRAARKNARRPRPGHSLEDVADFDVEPWLAAFDRAEREARAARLQRKR